MSDVVTTARSAREMLAQGLAALQSDPNIPPHLMELAGAVAQAMGALHQIERSQGVLLVAQAPLALSHVQTALAGLQAEPPRVQALVQAMEAVAGSLGLVHSLTRAAQASAAAPAPARAQVSPTPPAGIRRAEQPSSPRAEEPAWGPPPQQPRVLPDQQPGWGQQGKAAGDQAAWGPPMQAKADPGAWGPPPPPPPPPPAPPPVASPSPRQQAAAPRASGELAPVAADLGAHSPSNFYKGLSGNDIIEHGGIFVATYKIPKIGTQLRLQVSLPGGYEFQADAIVRWTRESSDSTVDTPPGFGAQFTNIAPEGKQLVHRYVRNREPLFHDDL